MAITMEKSIDLSTKLSIIIKYVIFEVLLLILKEIWELVIQR